ncbi:hypothetical protein V8E36_001062 [Tilletia maclaganii]
MRLGFRLAAGTAALLVLRSLHIADGASLHHPYITPSVRPALPLQRASDSWLHAVTHPYHRTNHTSCLPPLGVTSSLLRPEQGLCCPLNAARDSNPTSSLDPSCATACLPPYYISRASSAPALVAVRSAGMPAKNLLLPADRTAVAVQVSPWSTSLTLLSTLPWKSPHALCAARGLPALLLMTAAPLCSPAALPDDSPHVTPLQQPHAYSLPTHHHRPWISHRPGRTTLLASHRWHHDPRTTLPRAQAHVLRPQQAHHAARAHCPPYADCYTLVPISLVSQVQSRLPLSCLRALPLAAALQNGALFPLLALSQPRLSVNASQSNHSPTRQSQQRLAGSARPR